MSRKMGDNDWAPSTEQLAAYADGELGRCVHDLGLRERIEEWLAWHPQACNEVDAQRRLTRLWLKTAAEEPSEAAWSAAWSKINNPPRRADRKRDWLGRRWGWAAVVLFTAASVMLAIQLTSVLTTEAPVASDPEEPFPVAAGTEIEVLRIDGDAIGALVVGSLPFATPFPAASSDEVEVLRVNGADTDALVVGELPLHGPMVLADAGDITVMNNSSTPDDMQPEMKGDPPVIWATEPDRGE